MTAAADVAVLVAHRNAAHFLHDAVASLLGQTYVDLRLYLVDDASPNHEWQEVLAPLCEDSRLEVFATDREVGPYRIKNRLLQQVTEPIIAFHDADDLSYPERLARQVAALKAGYADVVGCSFHYMDTEGRPTSLRRMPRHPYFWHLFGRSFVALHPTTVTWRRVLSELGGFDGTTVYAADHDFFLRAFHRFRVTNLRDPLYGYRLHLDSLTGAPGTGFNSTGRASYRARVETANRIRWHHRLRGLPYELKAASNDVDFEMRQVYL